MSTTSERAVANMRRPPGREIAFYVRAKTGPGSRDWSPVGVAFARRNGPGYTIKLNTLPIDKNWNGSLVLVEPYEEEVDEPEAEQSFSIPAEPAPRRQRAAVPKKEEADPPF